MTRLITILATTILLTACGGGGGGAAEPDVTPNTPPTPPTALVAPVTDNQDGIDAVIRRLIVAEELSPNPAAGRSIPSVDSAKVQLGKQLFFSTHLGGAEDAACVSCHHPVLGGGDQLSLSVGVDAVDQDNIFDFALLGPGRHSGQSGNIPIVPRNAPSVFNAAFWDRGLFWDSRVSSLGDETLANGKSSGISTPDSETPGTADNTLPAGTSLPAAQARFPVTSQAEMRSDFAPNADNQALRAQLADRLDDELSDWPTLFEESYGDNTITFDRIGEALGEYERSMVFINSPWQQYVSGDDDALTEDEKAGAMLFYTSVDDGGAGCSRCHSGDTFSDEQHHIVAFPQVSDDIGREGVNGDQRDRYHFRTPSLLNVSATGPWGHAGLYNSLDEIVRHYDNPRGETDDLFGVVNDQPFERANPPFCQLPQIARATAASGQDCAAVFPDAYENSQLALQRLGSNQARNPLGPRPNLNGGEVSDLVAFLEALTDPCVEDRDCLDPWIVDQDDLGAYPDNSALIGHDEQKLDL